MVLVDEPQVHDSVAPTATATVRATGLRPGVLSTLFSATLLLSSFLLFSVQPLVARLLLPSVGGSSSLWTTAMLFFQTVLLVGYLTAHLTTRRLRGRQPIAQLLIVAAPLLVLPMALPDGWVLPQGVTPALWVLGVMAVMVGLPFFALSTASPTLQSWFARTDHPRAADPYFLYAAGNIGSVAALIAYPAVIERSLGLADQARWWAGGYLLFVVGVGAAAIAARRSSRVDADIDARIDASVTPIGWAQRRRWLVSSATPSLLLLAVTTHITTDLASFPLFWVVPLLLYLITHIVAFSGDSARRDRLTAKVTWLGAVPVGIVTILQPQLGVWTIGIHLAWFFAAALFCHSRLAADRPPAGNLTEFYVLLSVGGALGGLFASIVAPLAFDAVFEYPIGIAIAMALAAGSSTKLGSKRIARAAAVGVAFAAAAVVFGPPGFVLPGFLVAAVLAFVAYGPNGTLIALVCLVASGSAVLHGGTDLFRDRSFFGVTTVVERDGQRFLTSGTTVHGSQLLADGTSPEPTTYYHRSGPVGQVFTNHPHDRVGIVGLGTGAIVSYAESGDAYDLYEIDPVVYDLAADPQWFNYLSASAGTLDVTIGDGRQGLQRSDAIYDILVIDAFSSDSIPTHLLTLEAVELYRERTADDGVVMLHVSNRHFDLVPILGRIADELGLEGRVQRWMPTAEERAAGASSTIWVTLSEPDAVAAWAAGFEPIDDVGGALWTDDHADPLAALNLFD